MMNRIRPLGFALLLSAPLLVAGGGHPAPDAEAMPELLLPAAPAETKDATPAAPAASGHLTLSCSLREAFHGQVDGAASRANYVSNRDILGYLMLVPGHGAADETGPVFSLKSTRDDFASTVTLRAGGLDRYILRAGEQVRIEASEPCSGQVFTMVDADGTTGEINLDFTRPESVPLHHIILEPVQAGSEAL